MGSSLNQVPVSGSLQTAAPQNQDPSKGPSLENHPNAEEV